MPTIQSPTSALLGLPAINAGGIESSIVFHQLPVSAREAICSASDPQIKIRIAIEAGDKLPVMTEMYEHYIGAPARRAQAEVAFPSLAILDDFPLPGLLCEADRNWIRPQQPIRSIEVLQSNLGWNVLVNYADGQVRNANASDEAYVSRELAQRREQTVRQAAYILGLKTLRVNGQPRWDWPLSRQSTPAA